MHAIRFQAIYHPVRNNDRGPLRTVESKPGDSFHMETYDMYQPISAENYAESENRAANRWVATHLAGAGGRAYTFTHEDMFAVKSRLMEDPTHSELKTQVKELKKQLLLAQQKLTERSQTLVQAYVDENTAQVIEVPYRSFYREGDKPYSQSEGAPKQAKSERSWLSMLPWWMGGH